MELSSVSDIDMKYLRENYNEPKMKILNVKKEVMYTYNGYKTFCLIKITYLSLVRKSTLFIFRMINLLNISIFLFSQHFL